MTSGTQNKGKIPRSMLTMSGRTIKPSNHIILDPRKADQLFKDRVKLAFKGKSLRLTAEDGSEVIVPPRSDILVNFYEG